MSGPAANIGFPHGGGGSGGGISIGDAVGGGSIAKAVLFLDAAKKLANSLGLTWDDATHTLTIANAGGGLAGLTIGQAINDALIAVSDTDRNMKLLAGPASGPAGSYIVLGINVVGNGAYFAYTDLAYSVIFGNLGAEAENTRCIGTDETGAPVNGNRWKRIAVATDALSPLFKNRDNAVGDANPAADVQFRGSDKTAGTGNGGAAVIAGGTSAGGNQGVVRIGDAGTGVIHELNVSSVTPATDVLTLTNGPAGTAGNPAGFIQLSINGTPRVIPFW